MTTVFISMPYGDHNDEATRLANAEAAMDVWHQLADAGFTPYCPHLSHFLHERSPRPREHWLRQSLAWVRRCDCVLQIGHLTDGMRREEQLARRLDKPVYSSVTELIEAMEPAS